MESPGDLALQRGGDPGHLALAPAAAVPVQPSASRSASRPWFPWPGPLGRPAPLGQVPQRDRGVVQLAERLVGQAGNGGRGVRGGQAGRGTEPRRGPHPLLLHRGVRHQHQARPRAAARSPRQAGSSRTRAGRPRCGAAPAPVPPVILERVQGEGLVVPPRAAEGKPADLGRGGRGHSRSVGTGHRFGACSSASPLPRRLGRAIPDARARGGMAKQARRDGVAGCGRDGVAGCGRDGAAG